MPSHADGMATVVPSGPRLRHCCSMWIVCASRQADRRRARMWAGRPPRAAEALPSVQLQALMHQQQRQQQQAVLWAGATAAVFTAALYHPSSRP